VTKVSTLCAERPTVIQCVLNSVPPADGDVEIDGLKEEYPLYDYQTCNVARVCFGWRC
jgi:hypothetical protein